MQHHSIWGFIDQMTNTTHFLVKTIHSVEDYDKLYLKNVFRFHGVIVLIILDKGAHLTTLC